MKKFTLLAIATILLLSFQVTAVQPAYYSLTGSSSGQTLLYKQWRNLDETFFSDRRDGVVYLLGGSWNSTIDGLLNVSGTCALKRSPVNWYMNMNVGGIYYPLVDSSRTVASFDVTVPVQAGIWIQIASYQENGLAANFLACTILFDPVY